MDQEFSKNLRQWYRKNGRKLPWRSTKEAYKIWLSEIILQQTRVNQGLPYYEKFLENFPFIEQLASASEDQILRLWQGLGYYSRARNLHAAAKQVLRDFNGEFPPDFEKLRSIKGIGDYTASAIASFAFDLPHPVVDGNVYRFLSRFFGMDIPIDSSQGKKAFNELALELMDAQHAAEHNQAMMEIGSLVCKPISPNCDECPFSMACHAYLYNKVSDYPVKGKKQPSKKRYFHYFLVTDGISTYIKRRNEKDIWQGLFELPLVELFELSDFPPALPEMAKIHQPTVSKQPIKRKHILSHQELHACFWKVNIVKCLPPKDGFLRVKLSDLSTFGFPQLIVNYFEQEGL
ncbi:MAG: A/G-specific adenine glycosylase [Bacteroidetes bacterium]|nr:A/G-specific adenine glycosylase [Bacteroidota bacterium]